MAGSCGLSNENNMNSAENTISNENIAMDSDEDYEVHCSEGGLIYFIPICPNIMKPCIGKIFATLEEAIEFYMKYANYCGFGVRHGTTNCDKETVMTKFLLCSKEGYNPGIMKTGQRSRLSQRVGCQAIVKLRFSGSRGYEIYAFEERHTHKLVIKSQRQFMPSNRKLDVGHKQFILDCSKANIGPVRSYRLFKEIVGGYGNVGASATDFKNHRRDLLAYFDGSDAQTVINRFLKKRSYARLIVLIMVLIPLTA